MCLKITHDVAVRLQSANKKRWIGKAACPKELQDVWVSQSTPYFELSLQHLSTRNGERRSEIPRNNGRTLGITPLGKIFTATFVLFHSAS